MDLKSALKAALPNETRLLDRGSDSLYARVVEFTEHLEELGSLWLKLEHSWMATGRHTINPATRRPYHWSEVFFMNGKEPNEVRKALNRFLETNRLDVLSAVYDDQAQPKVDRVTPVLACLQKEIFHNLKQDGSYNGIEAVGSYINRNLPARWKNQPMKLRCAALFLKRYDESTGALERKSVLERVAGRLYSSDNPRADILLRTYQQLGGDPAKLEFWDEYIKKLKAERQARRLEEID